MGVRMLDLRLTMLKDLSTDISQFYCSHTFLSVPLSEVILDVWTFLREHPSETVLIAIRADHRVINADLQFCKRKTEVTKLSNTDMSTVVYQWISDCVASLNMLSGGSEVKMRDSKITPKTEIGELRSHIVIFPSKFSFDRGTDDEKPEELNLCYKSSWNATRHKDVYINMKLCREWCENL